MVFGAGVSGLSAARLLRHLGKDVLLVDQRPVSSEVLGPELAASIAPESRFLESQILQFWMPVAQLVLSPGISQQHPVVQLALQHGVEVIAEIELAYRALKGTFKADMPTIVAITGSNGKTTTTTLLAHLLKCANKKVFVGGNIGTPLCELAISKAARENLDLIILELSSFQLESLKTFHPDVAMIINLTMNHGERYKSLEDYGHSKFHISDRMDKTGYLFYPTSPNFFSSWAGPLKCHHEGLDPEQILLEVKKHPALSHFHLPGDHNLLNLAWACKALDVLKVTLSPSQWQQALESFHGVEHRLERVPSSRFSFAIYNDAKSTNFASTWTALSAFSAEKKLALIFGGKMRGGDLDEHQEELLLQRCHKIFLMGESASEYFNRWKSRARPGQLALTPSLADLKALLEVLPSENAFDVLIFSPGHPSFDQFKNYLDRGEKFKNIIAGFRSCCQS